MCYSKGFMLLNIPSGGCVDHSIWLSLLHNPHSKHQCEHP